ncbi:MAG: LCP family protein [Cyanobacteria bacterium J06638_6]
MTAPLPDVELKDRETALVEPEQFSTVADSELTDADVAERQAGRGRRVVNTILWSGLFVGTAVTAAVVGAMVALTVPLPSFLGSKPSPPASLGDLWTAGFRYQVTRPINILVMGIDQVPEAMPNSDAVFAGRTDTLLLVRVDAEAGTLNVMSIPRDTRVQIPGFGMDKVNQANVLGGPELVAQTLGYNLGNIQIDRYVRVNTAAFREMVDLVDGIEVDVPQRMEYTDRTQDLHIDLYPGWQTLNGDQAEQFARFRKESGDIGRVQRQQILLKALRERLTNPTVIPKLPQAIRVLQRYVDTNLTLEEMLAIANFGLEIEPNQLQMVMLPGRFSTPAEFNASYWLPNWDDSAAIMQNFFESEGVGLYADNSQGRYVADMAVAVQNASDTPEQAAAVARYLRENGFENVYIIGDWPTAIARTEVVAQRGDVDSARVLESLLGVGRAVSESTGDLNSDITIRVGQDWADRAAEPALAQ